jgi:hypothetical protein
MFKIAVNNIDNWVFVTGVPRSGSTFVGKILSLPIEVDYIHEPFNPQCGIPGMNRSYRYVRTTLDTNEMKQYHELTKSIFTYNLTLKNWCPKNDPWIRKIAKQFFGSRGPFYLRLAKINPFHKSAIIKDPTGNLLSEYLYKHFSVKPVIVIKHPISFIASLKRVNWLIQHSWVIDQPLLIEDYFANESEFINKQYNNPILGAAAYWRTIYKVLLSQANQYQDWQVFTHEELSKNPIFIFKNLYNELNLPWSESVKRKIISLTQENNNSARAKKGLVHDFKRNSADIFKSSLESVSIQERREIFEIVQDIALNIYSKKSFYLD